MAEKKLVTVFILDAKGVKDVMDSQGLSDKAVKHSIGCVYEDHPEIGKKLLAPSKDGVLHVEDIDEAIASYKAPKKKADEKKDNKKADKKADEKKGNYDTKVMTPSK